MEGDFSDQELDNFEESHDAEIHKQISNGPGGFKKETHYSNKHYDEAFEVSAELSMAESYDLRDKQINFGQNNNNNNNNNQQKDLKAKRLMNDHYDEAVEVSQSLDTFTISNAMNKAGIQITTNYNSDAKGTTSDYDAKGNDSKGVTMSRSQTFLNNQFDEAVELSQSGSEESIETTKLMSSKDQKHQQHQQQQQKIIQQQQELAQQQLNTSHQSSNLANNSSLNMTQNSASSEDSEDSDGSEEQESYDNIEGVYKPSDFQHLSVSQDVRELFQYIERYKPQEVVLETPLKCFIPEYIPSVGELDAILKIPRPDNIPDGLGLRRLDEPSAQQSDAALLELSLRARAKRPPPASAVPVRSISRANKNPAAIEKWISDVDALHRASSTSGSNNTENIHFKYPMPTSDDLLAAWPEEFELLLKEIPIPPPTIDLSLKDYIRMICAILDIPYHADQPLASLYLLFNLYLDIKNNVHFQQVSSEPKDGLQFGGKRGDADVLEINQEDYK